MQLNAFASPARILRNVHNGMVRVWCLLLLLGVVAGCATVGPWQQEGKTETQAKKDEWDCAREVQSMFPQDRTKMFRLCMGARGWKEVGRQGTSTPGARFTREAAHASLRRVHLDAGRETFRDVRVVSAALLAIGIVIAALLHGGLYQGVTVDGEALEGVMKIMVKFVAVSLCVLVLAYLFLMRPGRFQVAALDPSLFVVLDTATGRHHIYEVGLKDDSYELKDMEKGTGLWYRLRMW